jgi:hypothetical protein
MSIRLQVQARTEHFFSHPCIYLARNRPSCGDLECTSHITFSIASAKRVIWGYSWVAWVSHGSYFRRDGLGFTSLQPIQIDPDGHRQMINFPPQKTQDVLRVQTFNQGLVPHIADPNYKHRYIPPLKSGNFSPRPIWVPWPLKPICVNRTTNVDMYVCWKSNNIFTVSLSSDEPQNSN